MESGSNIELLFLDESEIHLYPHLVRMWMLKGQCVEIPAPGKNQKIPIYGALNYRTNKVSYHIGYGKNAVEFLGFLAQLAYEYRYRRCILVLDNASYHTACIVQKFLDELSSSFQVIWLPPYCPELNDIEHIWKYVKGASLANFDFSDTGSLRQAITEVFVELNSNPQSDLTLRFRDPLSKKLLKVA
jgi:putative transposase